MITLGDISRNGHRDPWHWDSADIVSLHVIASMNLELCEVGAYSRKMRKQPLEGLTIARTNAFLIVTTDTFFAV